MNLIGEFILAVRFAMIRLRGLSRIGLIYFLGERYGLRSGERDGDLVGLREGERLGERD